MPDSFELLIEGVDGSTWPIHGREAQDKPVRLLEGSLGEFYEVPLSTQRRPRVGQPGSVYQTARHLERHIVLRLGFLYEQWDVHEARFHHALNHERAATLVVRTPISGERRLKVRLEEAAEYADGRDPYSQVYMAKMFTVVADDPYWYEPAPATGAFRFSGSNWWGERIVVDNPTDVAAWPKWVCTAPAKFGLPDIDLTRPLESTPRLVYLPFQPFGSDYVIDTDPSAEMIVATDNTQAWAKMGGQFFLHPIPPRTPPTTLPVYVDPFPLLPFDLPAEWRIWIAQKLRALVEKIGLVEFLGWTPRQVGDQMSAWVQSVTPDWVPEIPADWIAEMSGEFLARMLEETIGKVSNIAGATAQIRVDRRWQRPWG